MSDLLAIFSAADSDHERLEAIAAHHPDRVVVLLERDDAGLVAEDSGAGQALRDRLAGLLSTIETQTGATVVGLAGDRAQLEGWRFDRELGARELIAA